MVPCRAAIDTMELTTILNQCSYVGAKDRKAVCGRCEKPCAGLGRFAGGGLIYLCNPNNPTSTISTRNEIAWLADNLPKNTYLLVDEAYLHYATSPMSSARCRS
jgi:histidinol-phosphate/aromatic aminotransferase/cobyric acid decarboxylase-like protein